MVREVFELLVQVNAGMHIACIGVNNGDRIERVVINENNRELITTIELDKTDIGFAVFKKKSHSSYIYNDIVTGEQFFESIVCIPYECITYVEFTKEEE